MKSRVFPYCHYVARSSVQENSLDSDAHGAGKDASPTVLYRQVEMLVLLASPWERIKKALREEPSQGAARAPDKIFRWSEVKPR